VYDLVTTLPSVTLADSDIEPFHLLTIYQVFDMCKPLTNTTLVQE
jgi:hypothetical protein